jgi:hypothetical protein
MHAVIVTYFDESGDDKREAHVAVGGIIAHEWLLKMFEVNWIKETADLKEPFRATDCECQHGQFKDWDKPECDDLMRRLVVTLSGAGNRQASVGCYGFDVPVKAYREVFAASDPMRLAIAHTIVEMARLARRHNEKIKLWFEDGPFHTMTYQIYRDLKALESRRSDERSRLYGISFDEKTLIPLQAADLVARESYKIMANRGKRNLRKPVLGVWDRLGMGCYTKEAFETLKTKGWPDNLEAVVSLPDTCYLREQKNYGRQYFEKPEYR